MDQIYAKFLYQKLPVKKSLKVIFYPLLRYVLYVRITLFEKESYFFTFLYQGDGIWIWNVFKISDANKEWAKKLGKVSRKLPKLGTQCFVRRFKPQPISSGFATLFMLKGEYEEEFWERLAPAAQVSAEPWSVQGTHNPLPPTFDTCPT